MLPVWVEVSHTLECVMNSMLGQQLISIPSTIGIEMMAAEKDQHYQFLVYVAERSSNTEPSVLECLCKSASPHIKTAMLTRLNTQRSDHLQQAAEIVVFAIEFEIGTRRQDSNGGGGRGGRGGCGGHGSGGRIADGGRGGRGDELVARVSGVDSRTCYGCAPNRVTLAIGTGTKEDPGSWILDSGSNVHLVRDQKMLKNAKNCDQMCRAANNTMVRVIKVGRVELRTVVDGKEVVVDLTEVNYSENWSDNIIRYGRLEERAGKSYVVRQSDKMRMFEVYRCNSVLMVDVMGAKSMQARVHVVNAAVREANAVDDTATESTLLELHRRFGHLAYDTVKKMTDAAGSGIRLTDRMRPNCLTCAQGKQSKNNQPKKDTGTHAPIDKIGGVIGSNIKGPMTPLDRRGDRYLINFVDYSTNYVPVFVPKDKVSATKMFQHFLAYFEKRFNCTIHVLRTDGGKEYVNVDPFCKVTSVRRQISKAENQASNGKAERMHRTVLNMARCVLFASELPLYFWVDAVEYTTYVLNRSACSANAKRISPLEMLTGTLPNLADMVTFGSPCTAFRDPGKKAWKPRAQVGMIVGKNDKTKGFKVYLPKDRVVITTQHIRNVETLTSAQNAQLQAQLEREDPELRRSIDGAAKRKEPTTEKSADVTQPSTTRSSGKKSRKKTAKKSRKINKGTAINTKNLKGADNKDEAMPPEEEPCTRMQTRNMGANTYA
ncbi:hypothetical protein PHMEG_00011234 [Phytophthora megakarya]|uniref:Integrase catalytic domain-containing protein n=1 Tax=Phytophthora megakarya TaxID=4795 RepID=A0A225WBR6_9STRA|nr:hypothetical protein PHMEG_00011234 [Phytophthora megakarya]